MKSQDTIEQRIQHVHERIAAAAYRAGRNPDDIALIAVTKTHPPERVAQAIEAGIYDVGENRVQEAQQKFAALALEHSRVRWHLIGHLQRNKAKNALRLFDMVHSLDSVRLAEVLNRHIADGVRDDEARGLNGGPLPVLIQVNMSGEASKEGFDLPGGLENADLLPRFFEDVASMLKLPHIAIQGLMTLAPFVSDPETVRPVFQRLRLLRDALAQRFPEASWEHLSMGMTNDFEVAIEEGATFVRIGRAIMGERACAIATPHDL